MRLILMVMVLFSGLCTVFAAVVTAAIAWTEHAEAQWPQVTARVDQCGLDETPTGEREMYYIRCRLIYEVGAEQNMATVDSVNVPSRAVWQYPPNQIGPLEDWIAEHPPGTPIVVHYDPDHHTKAVLVATDMPRGGPRTPSNVKLLKVCAGSFVILLTIARITRPRSLRQNAA
jgi:hypothetical protein